MSSSFSGIEVGDVYVFSKRYTQKDFIDFSRISGDQNPLHRDKKFAATSKFGKPIVPLHITAMPLSAVAGMVFPGVSSLYLSHELNALAPVYYDCDVNYSAKVIGKDEKNRILTVRTLAFSSDGVVFLEATQKIQSLEDSDNGEASPNSLDGTYLRPNRSVLITGAAGAVGSSTALSIARRGIDVVLGVRALDSRTDSLLAKIEAIGVSCSAIEMNLLEFDACSVSAQLAELEVIPTEIVHCASSGVHSGIDKLMSTNYRSLKALFEVVKPEWLKRQSGRVIFVSSSAVHYYPEGWEDYIAAKSASQSFCSSLNSQLRRYDIGAKVITPGLINSSFSQNLDMAGLDGLEPEQVAEVIVDDLLNPQGKSSSNHFWLERNGLRKGNMQFVPIKEQAEMGGAGQPQVVSSDTEQVNIESSLKSVISQFFNLGSSVDWENAALGLIPSWDSLNHMLLLIEIEKAFNVSISAEEINLTTSYDLLNTLLVTKFS